MYIVSGPFDSHCVSSGRKPLSISLEATKYEEISHVIVSIFKNLFCVTITNKKRIKE